jgi:peptidoglycan/LPS O-acetylase OafA/YrhL
MGTLRFILAILVAVGHMQIAGGLFGVGHVIGIKSFFIISGFYMSLILNEKYRNRPVAAFYTSRLLRLFPLYWIILAATVFAALLISPHPGHLSVFINLSPWKDRMGVRRAA